MLIIWTIWKLVMILAVTKWEVENNLLTPELKRELYLYHQEVIEGKFEKLLGDDEKELVYTDVHELFNIVYPDESD